MKEFKKTLMEPIPHTPLRLWHVLTGMVLLWVAPMFIPFESLKDYVYIFAVAWVVAYLVMNQLIKQTIRVSKVDVILIERFFILLTWLVPAVISTFYGIEHGFDTFITVVCVVLWALTGMLVLGITLHIKSAHKYYHGVKKDDLLK